MFLMIAASLLAAQSAKPLGFTAINYTGEWRDGISVTFIGDNVNTSQQDLFANRYVFAQAAIDESFVSLNIGVSFDDQPGPLEVDLQFGFMEDTGDVFYTQYHIPDDYTATSDFVYDTETGNGSLAWSFASTAVPDRAATLGLLAIGTLILSRFRK